MNIFREISKYKRLMALHDQISKLLDRRLDITNQQLKLATESKTKMDSINNYYKTLTDPLEKESKRLQEEINKLKAQCNRIEKGEE